MIYVSVPLDNYGTRTRPYTRASISIRIIHEYLNTHKYLRIPMNFFIFFTKKNSTFRGKLLNVTRVLMQE